jgi:YegS/Rv2252/BmrU family lipid kinase
VTVEGAAPARPYLIVNPASGGGRTGSAFAAMRGAIEHALGRLDDADVGFTKGRGHAIELARDAALAGRARIVAVGGDGTLHEVVNGVMQAQDAGAARPEVGLIGQGTGGDFRKTLGLEHRLDRYLAALVRGEARAIDVGALTYVAPDGGRRERFFVNVLSAGMGGLVDRYVATMPAGLSGKAAYFAASVRALATCPRGALRAEIEHDGARREEQVVTYMIAICNGRFFGGGMQVAPMAKPDDGQFEVVSIAGKSKLDFAMTSRKIYDGSHLAAPITTHFPCSSISLSPARPTDAALQLDVDGEALGAIPLWVRVRPSAIRFVY